LQIIELAMTYLNDALSQMKTDFKSLLRNLDLKELQSLLKPARLAEHALLLARAQSLHKRFDVILHIEPLLSGEQVDVGNDVANAKQWTVSETCKLLAAVKRVRFKDFEKPEEEVIGRILRTGGFGEGRSEKEMVGYVRQLEEYFGKADEEGLKFAEKCFREAEDGQSQTRAGSGRETVQEGLPDEYVRDAADTLRLIKASARALLSSSFVF
jgi:hypothetical protein